MVRVAVILAFMTFIILGGCGGNPETTQVPSAEPTMVTTPTVVSTPEQTATPLPTPTPIAIPIVDTNKQYTAVIETERGNITLELFDDDCPITVSNFVHLARTGFYDNTTFHRVIPLFMAQGGDPSGTGMGTPGYMIPDEITHHTHVTGALSMANMGIPDSGGCQFFITYVPKHNLDGRYAVFGQLVEGMDVLESLTPRDPVQNPDYDGDAVTRIAIYES